MDDYNDDPYMVYLIHEDSHSFIHLTLSPSFLSGTVCVGFWEQSSEEVESLGDWA